MYLVLDFGGTNIKAGLMECGTVKDFFTIPACSGQGMEQALLRVSELVREKGVGDQIEYVGIATPGVVDCKKRESFLSMINTPMAPGWILSPGVV